MIFLQRNNEFGQLLIEDILLFFDGPRLFVAINPAGQRFLVNCLDSADDNEDLWLLAAVSERRLNALRDAELPLREAFQSPELGVVQEITTSFDGSLLRNRGLLPSSLSDDVLPLPGIYLPSSLAEHGFVSAPFRARSLNANVILLRLFPRTTKHEAPARSVGEILSSFARYLQVSLDSSYRKIEDKLLLVGQVLSEPIPQVNVVGTFAGSLGVEFAVRGDEGTVTEALRSAVRDLSAVSDVEQLLQVIDPEEEHERLSSMKKFLRKLAEVESDLSVETASVKDDVAMSAEVPLEKVRSATRLMRVRRLEPETPPAEEEEESKPDTFTVELVGLNLRTRTFEVRRLDGDGAYLSGSINPEIFSEVSKAELPSRYRVVIETRGTRLWIISATKL